LNTTRNKRWNGKIDTLKTDYLNDVMEKMAAYGDRVQFGLTGPGQRPNYLIINTSGKKMAFDSNNHLLHPTPEEFLGSNITRVFTLDQIKNAKSGGGVKTSSSSATRTGNGSSRSSTTAVKTADLIGAAKYEYFKNNRQALPAGITKYSAEITALMTQGMSAEDAFGSIVKQYLT
jgi:hypothetical protein